MDYIFKIAAINSEIEFLSCSLKECLIQIEKQFPLGDDICMWGETMKKRGESWDEWLLKGDSLPGLIKKRNRIIVEMLEQQQQLMNQHPPQRLQQPPQSQLPQGQIQWIDFSRTEVYGNLQQWLLPRLGFAVFLPPAEKVAIDALKRALGAVNTHLASNTYLVGHSVTWADIVMTYNLYWGFKNILTKSFTSEFPHVERYFWNLVKQPKFQKVLGDIKQAESIPPVASKKSVQTKKPGKPKSKKKEAAPRPNSKHPLDLLPPSMMVLDDWKSLYSNTKTNFREVAIKGFWDMYDPEGYSLWFCNYKYNNENTVSFVTLNKVSGFLQQMDLARKYAFGKMLIIGSEPPFKVKGLWLFRGQEILNLMTEVYDMELYDWKQVDINDEGQKELVNQMIEDQDPFEGEALLHAKCFK